MTQLVGLQSRIFKGLVAGSAKNNQSHPGQLSPQKQKESAFGDKAVLACCSVTHNPYQIQGRRLQNMDAGTKAVFIPALSKQHIEQAAQSGS